MDKENGSSPTILYKPISLSCDRLQIRGTLNGLMPPDRTENGLLDLKTTGTRGHSFTLWFKRSVKQPGIHSHCCHWGLTRDGKGNEAPTLCTALESTREPLHTETVLVGGIGTAPGQSAQKGLGSLSRHSKGSNSCLPWYFSPAPSLSITWLGSQETF